MHLFLHPKFLQVFHFMLPILLLGCDSKSAKDFSFVEKSLFPLPVNTWVDYKNDLTRTIEFDCSFGDYAAWIVNLKGYRDNTGIMSDEDAKQKLPEIVEYLARKEPGNGYQGMYVGVNWIEESVSQPFAIQIFSYVPVPEVISVKIVCSHL